MQFSEAHGHIWRHHEHVVTFTTEDDGELSSFSLHVLFSPIFQISRLSGAIASLTISTAGPTLSNTFSTNGLCKWIPHNSQWLPQLLWLLWARQNDFRLMLETDPKPLSISSPLPRQTDADNPNVLSPNRAPLVPDPLVIESRRAIGLMAFESSLRKMLVAVVVSHTGIIQQH